ncbi:MAG: hypothetical protein ACFE7R_04350 [Candidatus Hodarchaeota archaeon]
MTDILSSYERGLEKLLAQLCEGHPRYTEALTLQTRLLENIAQTRLYGDTEIRRAERAQIIDGLNSLSNTLLERSFNTLASGANMVLNRKQRIFRTPVVRRILKEAFDDPGFDEFCQDHFPEVFRDFSRGMRKKEKITLLIDQCRSDVARDRLLNLLAAEASEVYNSYAEKLE